LENLKYINKKKDIYSDYNNNEGELFFYTLTESGLNFLLENENYFSNKSKNPEIVKVSQPSPYDDDIPF
jgi:hypothetical protein